jgi:hypothetical protein
MPAYLGDEENTIFMVLCERTVPSRSVVLMAHPTVPSLYLSQSPHQQQVLGIAAFETGELDPFLYYQIWIRLTLSAL